MKLYAPRYFEKFKCKADKCRHSCCVGWEIGVDKETICKYEGLGGEERKEVLSHIEEGVIKLTDDGRCPFLDDEGLCKIISRYGEDYISEICREHPRFYSFLPDRAEVGIGASCEEAARLIMSEEDFDDISEIGEIYSEAFAGFDTISERARIYKILKEDISYREKLGAVKSGYSLPDKVLSDGFISESLRELEYLREEDRETLSQINGTPKSEEEDYCIRFFAYLIYRHLSSADSYDDMRARVCLCLLLLRIFESRLCSLKDPISAAVLISEELEYSEDNISSLLFEIECCL